MHARVWYPAGWVHKAPTCVDGHGNHCVHHRHARHRHHRPSRRGSHGDAVLCLARAGPCKVNDVDIDGGKVGKGHGVLVERCRYLEEAGCASVCINSCKVRSRRSVRAGEGAHSALFHSFHSFISFNSEHCPAQLQPKLTSSRALLFAPQIPTQTFFIKDMGLPLTMSPNYEDYSCQFAFGKSPLPPEQDEAFFTPCFSQCPSKLRRKEGSGACGGIELPAA
jgi:hypothetical protein